MAVAGSWWASSTFWTAASVLVALVIGAATIAVARRGPLPRRRLHFGVISQTRLLPPHEGVSEEVRSNLALLHRGHAVADPHVVEIVLRGMGNRDIPSSAFDEGKPLRIHLGVQIIEQLQINDDPKSAIPTLPIRARDKTVEFGPGLFGRRQRISISLLVDGRPSLRAESPLPDVPIIKVNLPDALPTPISKYVKYVAIVFVLLYVLSQPGNAANVVNNTFELFGDLGQTLANAVNNLG